LALKEGGLDPEKDVTVLQIGNSGARITAILSGVVDGTIMAADFVPRPSAKASTSSPTLPTQDRIPFLIAQFCRQLSRSQSEDELLIKSMSNDQSRPRSNPTDMPRR